MNEVEHIFRHEYGPLVASLSRRVGVFYLDAVEDAVQVSLLRALEFWPRDGVPSKPSAWLYTVAYRQLLSEFRQNKRHQARLNESDTSLLVDGEPQPEIPLPGEMGDALLRMLFVACHEGVPIESQLVFTLKTLCGFSVREIALRLFISEANVYKRFSRAKTYLKSQKTALDDLAQTDRATRLPMVLKVLYLLFTEGYLSSHAKLAIRQDLCEEAIRLAQLLLKSDTGEGPECNALLALMHFHMARLPARADNSGALLLLEQQDRNLWDKQHIATALNFLSESAEGQTLSRYHLEAGIAAEHCLAPSFEETRWDKIIRSYELLEQIAPSALHVLNRAIAVAELEGASRGLAVLQAQDLPGWLRCSYHWHAVMADLQQRTGAVKLAGENAEIAIRSAPTEEIKQLLRNRFKPVAGS